MADVSGGSAGESGISQPEVDWLGELLQSGSNGIVMKAGNPPVRFDEREVETEQGTAIEAPDPERASKALLSTQECQALAEIANVGNECCSHQGAPHQADVRHRQRL